MEILFTDHDESSVRRTNVLRRSKESLSECKICDAPAAYSNFGVICCSPCKMFFKRNAEIKREDFICTFGDHCEINMNNRRTCSSCRLTKCFASGMKTELLRGRRSRKNRKREKKFIKKSTASNSVTTSNQIQQISTSNLLQFNQSILTHEQWRILSYVFDSFNEQSQFSVVQQFISEQNNLPFKLRFKNGPTHELISLLLNENQFLFEKNRDFLTLCSQDRSILLHRLVKYITIITFSFIAQQTDLIDCSSFDKILRSLFIQSAITTNRHVFTLRNSFDVRSLKLALAIICFSTFDYVVYENLPANNLINVKRIMEVQNMYIELTWRYLIHEYNEHQATVYFSNLIKYIFVVNETVVLLQDEKCFKDIVNSTIEQTEETLTDCN